MAKPKKMRNLVGILKDKVSLIKATIRLTPTRATSLHVAVLRATSHNPSHPPPDHLILDDALALTRPTAGALLHALLQRVHHTSNAYVALKCLITLHHIISCGSPVVNDQIIYFTEAGPLLNISTFRDHSDDDTCHMSNWIRWYAELLNQKTTTPLKKSLNLLVDFLEKISGAPDSLHYQKISLLVYQVIKLIGEEYRIIIREIYSKIEEIGARIGNFSDENLGMFLGDLNRIENRKEKLLLMFLNKKNNDGFWELIEKVRKNVQEEKQRRDGLRLDRFQGSESSRVDESRSIVIVPPTRIRRWLDVDWNPLVVSTNAWSCN